ncbi:uncharacterized protein PG986_007752 [Apiospora aurea]|uniref:Uncharacterized protein n=1 Tax=Apiospora aurea TaxID=335848 RepID=A0ABR1QDG5_9PEZI
MEDSEPGFLKRVKSVSVSNPTDVFRLSSGEEVTVRGDGRVCRVGVVGGCDQGPAAAAAPTTITTTTMLLPPPPAANPMSDLKLPLSEKEILANIHPLEREPKPMEKERLAEIHPSQREMKPTEEILAGIHPLKRDIKPTKKDPTTRSDHVNDHYYTTSATTPPHLPRLTTMAQESWGPQKLCDTLSLPKITVDET